MKNLTDLLNLGSKKIRWIVGIIVVILLVIGYYFLFIKDPYTTDAYVQANWVKIAARIYGPITEVYVKNNETVKKGQKLFQIDPTDYQLTYNHAKGELRTVQQQLDALRQSIQVAEHLVRERKAQLIYAQEEFARFKRLSNENAVSEAQYNQSQSRFATAKSQVNQSEYTVAKLKAELGAFEHNGELHSAMAKMALAKKKLSYTTIYSPVNGTLSSFYLRVGEYIHVGENLFSIVDNSYWWIQANYLEPEIERIKAGQRAKIRVSLFPGETLNGTVTSVGPAISRGRVISEKTNLPKVAETINWLRLFSRFPVFIQIDNNDTKHPLRVGATAAVIIETKG
ncbi:MAG: HlyD family secretion protein [Coxiellaceae bacterium]|nr:HlyD family secretion protein [Coxiellaceae bacterium]